MSRIGALAATAALACAPVPSPQTSITVLSAPILPFTVDTVRAHHVAPGVIYWFMYTQSGPWAIHTLDVDRDSCIAAVAIKGAEGAIGRERTSTVLQRVSDSVRVVGGVNADFFTPTGVPTGALVSRGRVITGPSQQPVLAFDSRGVPRIAVLRASGSVTIGRARFDIIAWNRRAPNGLALLDASWGRVTDTASSTTEVVLSGRNPSRVVLVDTTTAGVAIPADGAVLVFRGDSASPLGIAFRSLGLDETVRVEVSLAPFHPMEAVGGRPVLLRDSLIVAAVDTEGQPGFATGRHPRTAVGIARGGKRLILVVVDGRQKPYSDGMTLRELATLMRALGARDAINLDGGGSSTLVYADSAMADSLRVANRPSDASGERPVGNALAIVRHCDRTD
jgi:hypothetical protein